MKLTRKDLRRLIESAINEENREQNAAEFGLMTGTGLTALLALIETFGGTPTITSSGLSAFDSGAAVLATVLPETLTALLIGSLNLTASAAVGYLAGSYIQDIMTGNTGTEEEQLIYSFKQSAKDRIGELGIEIFGFDIAPEIDTLSDKRYLDKAIDKGFKGLKPRDIDKDRLGELAMIMFSHRNLKADNAKLPRELDELFAYRYLDAEAFKPFIEKKEKEIISQLVEKLKEGEVNESLSRGSLYRRRYYERY